MSDDVEVDLGDLHPDRLADTKRRLLHDLDRIDSLFGMIQQVCDEIAEMHNKDSVLADSLWDITYCMHEKLGRVVWLLHRQDVLAEMRQSETQEHADSVVLT